MIEPVTDSLTIHATAVVLGETGILIRGKSGAGKSSLGLGLVEAASLRGQFSRLVGDDRVRLFAASGRLLARPHERLAGCAEMREVGLLKLPYEPACIIKVLVDLRDKVDRLPDPANQVIELLGIKLYLLELGNRDISVTRLLQALDATIGCYIS